MNIFFLHKHPVIAAQMQCDKHVVKMVLETAQMLSTAARAQGHDVGYKSAYPKHPMTLWVGQNADNFRWAWLHGMSLAKVGDKKRFAKYKNCKPPDFMK